MNRTFSINTCLDALQFFHKFVFFSFLEFVWRFYYLESINSYTHLATLTHTVINAHLLNPISWFQWENCCLFLSKEWSRMSMFLILCLPFKLLEIFLLFNQNRLIKKKVSVLFITFWYKTTCLNQLSFNHYSLNEFLLLVYRDFIYRTLILSLLDFYNVFFVSELIDIFTYIL